MIKLTGILTESELAEYQQSLQKAQWQDGKTTAGHQARHVKNNRQLDENSDLARALGDHILRKLGQSKEFISAALPAKIYPPMFNCYQGGEKFGWHVDNAVRQVPGAAVKLRSDISITLFLTEPERYEGGELLIKDPLGQKPVKLAAGDALLYSADTVHQVSAVTRGCRYAAFFWVQSMIRSHQQRRILYDLDKSIQALTLDCEDNPETVRLTGVYHNLLREWAET